MLLFHPCGIKQLLPVSKLKNQEHMQNSEFDRIWQEQNVTASLLLNFLTAINPNFEVAKAQQHASSICASQPVHPPTSSPSTSPTSEQTSQYERVDPEERAYQKLEKAYTAKTEQAATAAAAAASGSGGANSKGKRGAEATASGGGEATEEAGARKKGKAGRWFD